VVQKVFEILNPILWGLLIVVFGILITRFWVQPLLDFLSRDTTEIKVDEYKPEYLKSKKHPEEIYRDGKYVQLFGKVDKGTAEWDKYISYVKRTIPDLQSTPYAEPCPKTLVKIASHDLVRIGEVSNYRRHDIWTCMTCGYTEAGWGSSGVYYENYYQHVGYIDPKKPRTYEKLYWGPKSKPRIIES